MADKPAAWSFYDQKTGAFCGKTYSGPQDFLAQNVPDGHAAIAGIHDHRSKRVDLETGAVIGSQPPARSADEERRELLREIAALEAGQARALREAALGQSGARERLQALEDQIVALRGQLTRSGDIRS